MPIDASGGRALPRIILMAVLAALAWGCGTRPPAPIEHRGGAVAAPPLTTPPPLPPAMQPAPSARTAPAGEEVQIAPVRPATPLESRPLESRGPDGRIVESRPSEQRPVEPRLPPAMVRNQPRGMKAPYSPRTFAEIAQADATAGAPASRSNGAPAGATGTSTGASGAAAAAGATSAPAAPGPSAAPPAASGGAAAQAGAAAGTDESRAADAALAWPAAGKVIQAFDGARHKGISIAGRAGDPVTAAADGRVIFSGVVRGYGNLVIVKHAGDLLSVYAHNRSLTVKEGQSVRRGQKIAEVGDSDSDRVALHFEVRRQGKPIDPAGLLPPR